MQGRMEHKIKIENKLKEKISHYPSWVSDYYFSLANYSHNTKNTYINKVCLFLDRIFKSEMSTNEQIASITATDINRYIDELKSQVFNGRETSKNTINLQIGSLKHFFDFLTMQGYISENPVDKAIKRPKTIQEHQIIYLETNEIKKLLKNIESGVGNGKAKSIQKRWKSRDKLLILLPLVTGMRVSALDEINIEDIDFEKGTIQVIEKREKERVFELNGEMMDLIEEWLEDRAEILKGSECNALFIGKTLNRLTVRSIERIVKKYCEGISKPITPHKLRSTYGTQYYRQTGDIYLTAEMMGHNSTKTTSRYVAIDNTKKSKENIKFMDNVLSITN